MPAALWDSWRASFRFFACIGTLNCPAEVAPASSPASAPGVPPGVRAGGETPPQLAAGTAALRGSWRAPRFLARIGTMNPPLTPPGRGTDRTRTNACSPPGRGRSGVLTPKSRLWLDEETFRQELLEQSRSGLGPNYGVSTRQKPAGPLPVSGTATATLRGAGSGAISLSLIHEPLSRSVEYCTL